MWKTDKCQFVHTFDQLSYGTQELAFRHSVSPIAGQLSSLDNSYSMCELEQLAFIKSVHSIRTVELSVMVRYRLQHSSLPHLNNGHTPSDMCASRLYNLHHRDRYYGLHRIYGTIGTLCCVCNVQINSIK